MKIGITASSFDLLHAGHVAMLREAKSVCDHLIVALQTDPTIDRKEKNKPIQSLVERYIQLSAVKYVDEIVVYSNEAELLQILQIYPIDIRIIGEEYRYTEFTGRELCVELGIEIYFNKRNHGLSSSSLRNLIYEDRRTSIESAS